MPLEISVKMMVYFEGEHRFWVSGFVDFCCHWTLQQFSATMEYSRNIQLTFVPFGIRSTISVRHEGESPVQKNGLKGKFEEMSN